MSTTPPIEPLVSTIEIKEDLRRMTMANGMLDVYPVANRVEQWVNRYEAERAELIRQRDALIAEIPEGYMVNIGGDAVYALKTAIAGYRLVTEDHNRLMQALITIAQMDDNEASRLANETLDPPPNR